MVAVRELGTWFAGGCIFWLSDQEREFFHGITDAEKRKIHPQARVIARVETSGRVITFRDDEVAELVILDE